MFENILHQPVVNRIGADYSGGVLAPAILFSGREYSGKGTAALELARLLSCEGHPEGLWNCSCPSCKRHRNLVSADLLLLGRRRFFEEIAASSGAFLRQQENTGSRMLFIRSVRKLLARFSPVLWEDDPKLGKLRSSISALEEELEDFENVFGQKEEPASKQNGELEKISGGIIKKAAKLEAEGMSDLVPVAQIRRASYWSRLSPLGLHKCVVIENAEHMQEGAKNSLLKILEEPPPRVTFVLTSSRPGSLLPTILSRLREYRFVRRSAASEAEVIGRIFRESRADSEGHDIESYLASFLPVKRETLYILGAWFAASAAAAAARECKRAGRKIPESIVELGKFSVPIAEAGGMGRPAEDFRILVAGTLRAAEGFEIPGLFPVFLRQLGELLSTWLREGSGGIEQSLLVQRWRKELGRTALETGFFNIGPALALERLLEALKTEMVYGGLV